jgi:hypothetical protein
MSIDYNTNHLYFSYGYWGKYSGNPNRCIRLQVWCPRDTGYNPGGKNGWYSYSYVRMIDIDLSDKTIMSVHTSYSVTNLRGKKVGTDRYRVYDKLKRNLQKVSECPFWAEIIHKYSDNFGITPLTDAEYQELSTHPLLT